ncbi:GntR family transcriptional regulator [Paenibacillus silvae]|nr:GntR family transcriptional regulator [Paenibacillus silvae]
MENFNFSSMIKGNKDSLPDQIANFIFKKIFTRELPQGTRLIESNIAKELNVSNIPVREAFYILLNTGVLEKLPRKGVRVKSISSKELHDYTDALIDLFALAVDYSMSKWDDNKRNNLKQYYQETNEQLERENLLEYIVKLHRLCGYVFEVADNKAFIKFYYDITFITNAYSQIMWGEIEKTRKRNSYVGDMVDALLNSNFELAKKTFDVLTRESLSL